MKTARAVAVAIVSVTSIPLMALQLPNGEIQDASGTSSLSGSASSQSPQVNAAGPGSASGQQSANAAAHAYSLVVSEMRPVSGNLEGKLNSQSAKPGDLVIVKTMQSMTTADGTEIPKGSRLLGHVIAAQAYASGVDSLLSIAFDRAEFHGGASVAIHSMIQSISPRGREASDSGYSGVGAGMSSGPAIGEQPGAVNGGMNGRGSLGGTATGARVPVTGQAGAGVDRTSGSATDATNPSAVEMPASAPGPTYGVVRLSDSLAPRYTGFTGVMLQADPSGVASGTLFAASQMIRLDAGTRVVLGIVATGK